MPAPIEEQVLLGRCRGLWRGRWFGQCIEAFQTLLRVRFCRALAQRILRDCLRIRHAGRHTREQDRHAKVFHQRLLRSGRDATEAIIFHRPPTASATRLLITSARLIRRELQGMVTATKFMAAAWSTPLTLKLLKLIGKRACPQDSKGGAPRSPAGRTIVCRTTDKLARLLSASHERSRSISSAS